MSPDIAHREGPADDSSAANSSGADFSAGEASWRRRLGLLRDVVRQELVHRQLMNHLGQLARPDEVQIVDVGCGQGTQALRLGRAGFRVIGVDPSTRLLADAVQSLGDEPAAVQGRVAFERGDLEHLDQVGGAFDVVCCHGVLMYLASLDEALGRLVEVTKLGGLVSVLTKNRASLAMRAGLRGAWLDALGAFDARLYTNSLGVELARADDPEEVMASLGADGADLVVWYGVRLFTDHWGDVEPPGDVEALLAAEEAAGRRDPYRGSAPPPTSSPAAPQTGNDDRRTNPSYPASTIFSHRCRYSPTPPT